MSNRVCCSTLMVNPPSSQAAAIRCMLIKLFTTAWRVPPSIFWPHAPLSPIKPTLEHWTYTHMYGAPEVHTTAVNWLDVWQPQPRRRREKGSGSASVSFLPGSPYWPVKPLWLEQMQMALTCSHEILKAPFKWGPGPQCGSGPALCGGLGRPQTETQRQRLFLQRSSSLRLSGGEQSSTLIASHTQLQQRQ